MHRPDLKVLALSVLVTLAACGEVSAPPTTPDPVRTLLYYSLDDGQTFLVNSDGSGRRRVLLGGGDSVTPIAVAPGGTAVALLTDSAILVTSLNDPTRADTVIAPVPQEISLAAFSSDQRFVGIASYLPEPVLLVYDRANRRLDTLSTNGTEPALPPIFAPDNNRIALIGATALSLYVTVVERDHPELAHTSQLAFSRFLNRPLFGWPLWTSEGILIAVVRVANPGPDTVLSVRFDPDHPERDLVERYRAVLAPVSDERPEVQFGARSTYSYAASGAGLALGAQPGADSTRHAIYYVSPAVHRIRLVLDNPKEFPVFPLLIN